MTPDDIPHWSIRGRPVKSTALGLAVIMATFTYYNIANTGIFGTSWLGDIVAAFAFAAFVMLTVGWFTTSQRLVEYGLLGAAAVYITRTVFLLTVAPHIEGVWIGVGVSIIAGGAYLKERWGRDT